MAEFDPNKPFNDLPLLPPPAEQIETNAILKQCINARVALAELKQARQWPISWQMRPKRLLIIQARTERVGEDIGP